jgi:hypothetical protein
VPRLPSQVLTVLTHNSEQELTWLAGENARVPYLPSCPRMKERSQSRQAAQLAPLAGLSLVATPNLPMGR